MDLWPRGWFKRCLAWLVVLVTMALFAYVLCAMWAVVPGVAGFVLCIALIVWAIREVTK